MSEEALKTETSESGSEKDGYIEQIKRLQADFENWRKRVEQDKLYLIENASAVLLEKLLPVIDNLERALAHSSEGEGALKEGLVMTHRQLVDLLKEQGLVRMETIGKPFDPSLHEAIGYEERTEGEDHQVIEEARKGYLFKGRVLRPALVKVSKITGGK